MSTEGGMRAVLAALIANLGIAAAKFVAFFLTTSTSMLSEAVHSLADSGNQILLLLGSKHAKRTTSVDHDFGYGRVRYIYGFVVSIVLFVVGGAYSLYEGIHKWQHPESVGRPEIAIAVLVVAILLESFSLRTAIKEVNHIRGRRTIWQFVRASRQPELPVIVLEDIGALVGLVFAFTGVVLSTLTKDARFDGLGAMAVGVLLVIIAIILSFEMTSMLVGESALEEDRIAITNALESNPLVNRLIHLRTLHVGPDELLVAAKVAVSPHLTAVEIGQGIDTVEGTIRSAVPNARYIFIEPDIDHA